MSSVLLYKPKSVTTAFNIFSFAVLLGLAMSSADLFLYKSDMLLWFPLGMRVAVYAAIIALMLMVSRRMNLARWLFAVLYLVALYPAVPMVMAISRTNVVLALLSGAQLVLLAIGLILLFRPHANAWFRG